MANSKFEYVRDFEQQDPLLKNTWLVVRLDGRGFHKFSQAHDFAKPNDVNALGLMNHCAKAVMEEFDDIMVAYGESDEYSFILHKDTNLFKRRASKIMTSIVSYFAANYVMHWPTYMGSRKLQYPPQFDARIVCYPAIENVRDYLCWRQADCHINNLYNTCFWTLVLKGGLTEKQAEQRLCGTVSSDKNEILFSDFGLNYNDEPAIFRKGSVLRWQTSPEVFTKVSVTSETDPTPVERTVTRFRRRVVIDHIDVITNPDVVSLEDPKRSSVKKHKRKKTSSTKASSTFGKAAEEDEDSDLYAASGARLGRSPNIGPSDSDVTSVDARTSPETVE